MQRIKVQENSLLFLLLFEEKLVYVCGWRWAVLCKSWNLFLSIFLQLFLSSTVTLRYTHTHTHTQNARLVVEFSYFVVMNTPLHFRYSILESAYKSWSDPSHSLFLSSVSHTDCKHTLKHTVTGHFIFNKVKGHSIWQHSIAYSCEMNLDHNKIDN